MRTRQGPSVAARSGQGEPGSEVAGHVASVPSVMM